jgi:NADH-quinone oxidoreductase subunit M
LLKLGSYGILRIVNLVFLKIFKFIIFFWLISSIVVGVITFIHSDIKKVVAYRRVTHITFLIIGLSRRTKSALIRFLMLSLAHGWSSAGMFASAGMFRSSSGSRLGYLIGAGKFN